MNVKTDQRFAEIDQEIDWGAYAVQYDLMCSHNSYYGENIEQLLDYLESIGFDGKSHIADIGAGTGNFITELANKYPDATFTHIDSNREMNKIALQKYDSIGLANVQVIEEDVQRLDFSEGSFDLVLCINALYAMQPQQFVLTKIRKWIAPKGLLYVLDLGRKMDSTDWGLHFLRKATKEGRLISYLTDSLLRGREVFKQNQMTTIAQDSGRYWTHETEDFGTTLAASGYQIELLESCYRGYADLAICTLPTDKPTV